ncbi:MAG: hypothetical protein ACRCTE_08950 [Cellulosilyticaceae bacterium]
MLGQLVFSEDDYDLEGLLRISEEVLADFIFMIQEDDAEIYYLDRHENQKYDSSFNKFIMRAKDYLENDEMRGLFVLFASGTESGVKILDGNHKKPIAIDTGDIELEEGVFYGMMIQYEEGDYVFHETLFTRESYQGDAHAERLQDMGELSDLLEQFILEFK